MRVIFVILLVASVYRHHLWPILAVCEAALIPSRIAFLHHAYQRRRKHEGFKSQTYILKAASHGTAPQPPVAFRNESSFVLAGDIGANSTLRQSPSSPYPLLKPPRSISDPYGWLRDESRSNKTVLAHLHAENEYTRQMTRHLIPLQEELYNEFLSTICETDYTPPTAMGKYWYYSRWEEGVSYPRYCRAPRNLSDLYPPKVNDEWNVSTGGEDKMQPLLPGEEVYLDVPSITQNKSYLAVGAVVVSPNHEYVAYSVDEIGDEICHFVVRHILSGVEWILYDDNREEAKLKGYGAIEWDEKSRGLFYVTMDETQRPYGVYYRQLFHSDGSYINKSEHENDVLLWEERDKLFNIHIAKTFDSKYLLIMSTSTEASEVRYLDLFHQNSTDWPTASNLSLLSPKRDKVIYRVTHCNGYWLIMTNMGRLPNLSLKACRVGQECNRENWKDVTLSTTGDAVFDGGDQRSLDHIMVFDLPPEKSSSGPFAYGVAHGREDGLPRVWILEFREDEMSTSGSSPLMLSKMTRLEFNETAFEVAIGENRDPTLPYVVIKYDSLVTPLSHIAVPLANARDLNKRRVLKEMEVPFYNKDLYACERTTVKSRDEHTDIPVSLVYRRDIEHAAAHLFGYGSYGSCIEASFRATRLPLLNRGIFYAIAHVRGGGENGRQWYEAPFGAKYLCKKNSFNDFVDVAHWLTRNEVIPISAPKLSIEGRSAGGLLVGAAMNQAPHIFRAAILGVPFVDVLCTMTDPTLPLTISEWEEWGNPNEEQYFEYIKSYSPINNVNYGKVYPSCLLTGGLADPRVQYWEPAKFAAELRHSISKDSGNVLLKMDMEAGHFSGHDRYKYLRDLSFEYAFLLDELGLA